MNAAMGSLAQVPLSSHVLFQSDDLDCARERVAQKFCRHRLDIIGNRRAFRAAHHHAAGDMISLNYISYGADVLIDPGELEDFYLIQIPVAGTATIRNGRKEFLTGPRTASVLNADLPTRMRWWVGCAQILIQVRKAPFLAFAEQVADRALPGPLRFDPLIDFSRPEMRAWRGLAAALFHAADRGGKASSGHTLQTAFDEQRLLEMFLRHQPSTMTMFMDDMRHGIPPRQVRRAEDFIRARAADPITLLDIAQAAGVSARSLQMAYKSTYGLSPMRALRRERLRRVRVDLTDGDGAVSIADTALKWGFSHLGRFAASYRREFGELPRETVSRGNP